ncbi:MAG TPA: ECF transporter S component [Firmicutes bacterium]|nr:ECF transporter S component [Bacillota bacterium]
MSGTRRLTWGALFVAIGVLLPMMFHVVNLGKMFLPMHIPVLLAGFFCGPLVGMLVGLLTPLASAVLTGMPPLMPPVAQMMVFELGIYGLLTGFLYQRLRLGVYPALVAAMVAGRLVYGLLGYLILPLFGLQRIPLLYPVSYGLLSSLPGIILQLVLIPGVVFLVERNAAVLVTGKKATRVHA